MTYVRNAWYVAAWAHEVAAERPAAAKVLNEPIVIWRIAAGELVAFEDRCIHRLAPLSLGRCEGDRLRCGYHGLLYDRTGRVVEIPGQDKVPLTLRVRSYPVVERYGWIWVWMGDAKVADEGLIPLLTGLNDPNYACGTGQLDFEAEARLVNDNLLDLSHVSFLHTQTAGTSENWARDRPTISEQDRGLRIERWLRGAYAGVGSDVYSRYDFFVPGIFLYTENAYPLGTADALNGKLPPGSLDRELKRNFALQAITPITDRTARSLYIMASHHDHGGEAQRDVTMSVVPKIFAEDKTMIEAQQRIIDTTPGWRFVATSNDHGVVLFNRLVEKLVRNESAQLSQGSQHTSSGARPTGLEG